jgi:hypothetical protein
MVDVAPLAPLSYAPDLLSAVVAPPYDVIDAELRQKLSARHPENVVHVDLPSGDGARKYAEARRLLADWQERGVLRRDRQPAFWRYAQTFDPPGGGERRTRRGFFALVRVEPYSARVILPHERTLTGPKVDRLELGRATRTAISPGFMLYSDPERGLDASLDGGDEIADFSTDGVRHQPASAEPPGDRQHAGRRGCHRGRINASEIALCLLEIDVKHAPRASRPERAEHHYFLRCWPTGRSAWLPLTHRLVHCCRADSDAGAARGRVVCDPASGAVEDLASAPARALRPPVRGGADAGCPSNKALTLT